jgi:CspA family cold shock protein
VAVSRSAEGEAEESNKPRRLRNNHDHRNGDVFQREQRFGFIAPEGGAKDVFVHATAVEAAGMNTLSEGQRVSFDVEPDARGQKAVNLERV